MDKVQLQSHTVIPEGRHTDEELLAMVSPDLRNSPSFQEGFAEGIRKREAFRAEHGRFPEVGEAE